MDTPPIPNELRVDTTKPPRPYFSWGQKTAAHNGIASPSWMDEIGRWRGGPSALPFGLGRSYGDSCLNEGGVLIDCTQLDRILSFDRLTGRMVCEGGVSLATILEVAVSRGWFLPVTPGTKYVTVGGAIANDVHGKNHHIAGTFGAHVLNLTLVRSDGTVWFCSPQQNENLFAATIGGLGLTGVIAAAEVQLKSIVSPLLDVETIPYNSLDEFFRLTMESESQGFEHNVAWLDCLSRGSTRGVFFCGTHSDKADAQPMKRRLKLRVPFVLPDFVMSEVVIRGFNRIYHRAQRSKPRRSTVHYEPFFYPLDAILNWNRIYGHRGLVQYQCVVPMSKADAFASILEKVAVARQGSFLGVIKRFGGIPSPGMLSFPREGYTLALDFPYRGEATLRLFAALDELVIDAGGALYPAKDGRMSREMFQASYPRIAEFTRFIDPGMSSSFWQRVK